MDDESGVDDRQSTGGGEVDARQSSGEGGVSARQSSGGGGEDNTHASGSGSAAKGNFGFVEVVHFLEMRNLNLRVL